MSDTDQSEGEYQAYYDEGDDEETVVVNRADLLCRFGASFCEGCEGNGDLRCHGLEDYCGMCEGTGRIADELSRYLSAPPRTEF